MTGVQTCALPIYTMHRVPVVLKLRDIIFARSVSWPYAGMQLVTQSAVSHILLPVFCLSWRDGRSSTAMTGRSCVRSPIFGDGCNMDCKFKSLKHEGALAEADIPEN